MYREQPLIVLVLHVAVGASYPSTAAESNGLSSITEEPPD